jgi:hypothetical protein
MHTHCDQLCLAAAAAVLRLCLYSPNDNAYAHPLDLVALVDLHQKCVVGIDRHSKPPQVRLTPAAVRAAVRRPGMMWYGGCDELPQWLAGGPCCVAAARSKHMRQLPVMTLLQVAFNAGSNAGIVPAAEPDQFCQLPWHHSVL